MIRVEQVLEHQDDIHPKETEFKCHVCTMAFKKERQLAKHCFVHFKPIYACDFCEKLRYFKSKMFVIAHVTRHHVSVFKSGETKEAESEDTDDGRETTTDDEWSTDSEVDTDDGKD